MAAALAGLGFPPPAQLQNQQYVFFQIGGLIDKLAMVCAEVTETTNSDFKFTVTDNAGQKTVITLKYVKTVAPAITYNNDADLWANTASFTLSNIPADATSVSVQYKKSTASDTKWQTAEITGNNTKAEIKPDWGTQFTAADWTTPNSVQPFWRITEGTGVFANNTYDYKLTVDGTEYKGQFKTGNGDVIPDGNMENTNLPCFTQNGSESSTFWGSGNNDQTPSLCTQITTEGNKYAVLQSKKAVIVLAAGNLFTGTFKYTSARLGGTGAVNFGQKYTYTARPSALQVKYRAKINAVDMNVLNGPLAKKEQDKARIFVAIINWTSQHTVSSTYSLALGGSNNGCVGGWDPETTTNPGEGKIIGYGSLWLTESAETDWQNADIQIQWYDKAIKPTEGNYSLIISCAANAYGDYMNGCTSNFLHIDDIQWVY